MKGQEAVRYKITPKGRAHFAFLGDPELMGSDAEREEAERKRKAMTMDDWALQQLLAFMGQDTETFAGIESEMTRSHDSLLDGSFHSGDPELTKETAQVFAHIQKNLSSLLHVSVTRGFITMVDSKKRPINPILVPTPVSRGGGGGGPEIVVVTREVVADIEAIYKDDAPEVTEAIQAFKRWLHIPD